jgi:Rad3-related DNA helicase
VSLEREALTPEAVNTVNQLVKRLCNAINERGVLDRTLNPESPEVQNGPPYALCVIRVEVVGEECDPEEVDLLADLLWNLDEMFRASDVGGLVFTSNHPQAQQAIARFQDLNRDIADTVDRLRG